MNRLHAVAAAVVATLAAGCAHDSEGHQVREGLARFDATSVGTSGGTVVRLLPDGTWGLGMTQYERVGDQLRAVGGVNQSVGLDGPLIRGYSYVTIERLPNGVRYTPSYYSAPIWTFVTEDGKGIPVDLEVPLYFAARIGLGGQWVNIWEPPKDDTGPHLVTDCGVVLFELRGGRQVAGWLAHQGAICPAPKYPGRETLARLIYTRNEVWESPQVAAPSP